MNIALLEACDHNHSESLLLKAKKMLTLNIQNPLTKCVFVTLSTQNTIFKVV